MNKAFRRVLPLLVIGVIMLAVSGVMLYKAFTAEPVTPAASPEEKATAAPRPETPAPAETGTPAPAETETPDPGPTAEDLRRQAADLLSQDTREACLAAIELLTGLDDADSAQLLARAEARLEQLRPRPLSASVQVGDHVLFGSFEQDGDESDGAEPLEWIVVERQDGKALLISRYALWYDGADTGDRAATGARWLANDFIITAFSPEERSCLLAEGAYIGRGNMRAFLPTGAITLAPEGVRVCLPTEAARQAAGEETAGPVVYLGANRVSVYTENFTVFRVDETGSTIYSVIQKDPAYVRPMIAPDLSRFPG